MLTAGDKANDGHLAPMESKYGEYVDDGRGMALSIC